MITIMWTEGIHRGYKHFEDNEKGKAKEFFEKCVVGNYEDYLVYRPDGKVWIPPKTKIRPFVNVQIAHNAMKPSEFIRIVTGLNEQDFLPHDAPTYISEDSLGPRRNEDVELATEAQVCELNASGIFWTKGLTKKQAAKLVQLLRSRKAKKLAEPWEIKAVMSKIGKKKMSVAEKYEANKDMTSVQAKALLDNKERRPNMYQIVYKKGKETPFVNAYTPQEVMAIIEPLKAYGYEPNVFHKADKPEPKPVQKLATVAIKTLDYIVPDDAEPGDMITVILNGQVMEYEILKVHTDKKPNIKYVHAEELKRRKGA